MITGQQEGIHRQADQVVDKIDGYSGQRDDLAGKVDLGHQVEVAGEAGDGKGGGAGEESPRQHTGEIEEGVGVILVRGVQYHAEDEGEEQHQAYRLQDRPQHPDGGLFVADQEFTPDEDQQQVFIGIKTLEYTHAVPLYIIVRKSPNRSFLPKPIQLESATGRVTRPHSGLLLGQT